jgi:hypothetical protein
MWASREGGDPAYRTSRSAAIRRRSNGLKLRLNAQPASLNYLTQARLDLRRMVGNRGRCDLGLQLASLTAS